MDDDVALRSIRQAEWIVWVASWHLQEQSVGSRCSSAISGSRAGESRE